MASVYTCPWCKKEYVSLRELNAHTSGNKCSSKPKPKINSPTPKKAYCDKCGNLFTTQQHLKQHKPTCKGKLK